jgi:hypothetical protein
MKQNHANSTPSKELKKNSQKRIECKHHILKEGGKQTLTYRVSFFRLPMTPPQPRLAHTHPDSGPLDPGDGDGGGGVEPEKPGGGELHCRDGTKVVAVVAAAVDEAHEEAVRYLRLGEGGAERRGEGRRGDEVGKGGKGGEYMQGSHPGAGDGPRTCWPVTFIPGGCCVYPGQRLCLSCVQL